MTDRRDSRKVSYGRVQAANASLKRRGSRRDRPPKYAAFLNKSFANSLSVPKTSHHRQNMSPFSTCISAPSSFSVMHPLYCGSAAYHLQKSLLMTIDAFAKTPTSPSELASPTTTKNRAHPAASPNKKVRKSRIVFDFSTEEMAKYFHMSQREAAQQLGVATVTIKRNCRRLGIVWPYRIMKSKKNAINCSSISREDAQRIRQERALERAKAGRSPFSRKRAPSTYRSCIDDDEAAANAMTMLSHNRSSVELTEAGHAFARLPLDCMYTSE